jgi:hypothetical protein
MASQPFTTALLAAHISFTLFAMRFLLINERCARR